MKKIIKIIIIVLVFISLQPTQLIAQYAVGSLFGVFGGIIVIGGTVIFDGLVIGYGIFDVIYYYIVKFDDIDLCLSSIPYYSLDPQNVIIYLQNGQIVENIKNIYKQSSWDIAIMDHLGQKKIYSIFDILAVYNKQEDIFYYFDETKLKKPIFGFTFGLGGLGYNPCISSRIYLPLGQLFEVGLQVYYLSLGDFSMFSRDLLGGLDFRFYPVDMSPYFFIQSTFLIGSTTGGILFEPLLYYYDDDDMDAVSYGDEFGILFSDEFLYKEYEFITFYHIIQIGTKLCLAEPIYTELSCYIPLPYAIKYSPDYGFYNDGSENWIFFFSLNLAATIQFDELYTKKEYIDNKYK